MPLSPGESCSGLVCRAICVYTYLSGFIFRILLNSPWYRFGLNIFELSPKSSYAFRVKILYGDAASSAASDRSPVCTTKPIEPPTQVLSLRAVGESEAEQAVELSHGHINMRLEFLKPLDDGGRDIIGYADGTVCSL